MLIADTIAKLKPGREKPVAHGHPWVFSGAVAEIRGAPAVGDIADVVAADDTWLARGLVHPGTALTVRLYTRRQEEALDGAFFARRLDAALALRARLFDHAGTGENTDAYRLVYSEADGLSGLIVDRYAGTLAVQVGAKALVSRLGPMLDHLRARTGIEDVVVAADEDAVTREQLDPASLPQAPAHAPVRIRQDGLLFDADLSGGQKTGFYLDQRVNRGRVARYAADARVLSAYCYTGAFEVYAAAGGAREIVGIDSSESALSQARKHHELNGGGVPVEYTRGDVPEVLRRLRDAGRDFDLVILDPPRFVANRAQMDKGLRAYKDINLLAMKLLVPGGILASFSCSGLVSRADFRRMLAWASADAGKDVRVLEELGQPPDHPVLASCPETEYLKGVICAVG